MRSTCGKPYTISSSLVYAHGTKYFVNTCLLFCPLTEPVPKCATRASRYGCCWDNKTEAKSYAGEGCPGKKTKNNPVVVVAIFPWPELKITDDIGENETNFFQFYFQLFWNICKESDLFVRLPDWIFIFYLSWLRVSYHQVFYFSVIHFV